MVLANNSDVGDRGEVIARNFLNEKGYDILGTNYFFKSETGRKVSEIDIIAKIRKIYIFVEVKTIIADIDTNISTYFRLEKKINRTKVRKIILAANKWFIEKKICMDQKWQIDVIGVILDKENLSNYKLMHFENVFEDNKF